MRRAAFLAVVFVVSLGCEPRVPPPPPAILPLDTDALAIGGIEQAQDAAERLVALAGVVGAFIGTESDLFDAVSDGGLDRVVDRGALASASCDAAIARDASGAVHASWPEPCNLSTGSVVSGDLTIVEGSDGNALTVVLLASADGLALNGLVWLTPQFWPIAWLQTDFLDNEGLATVAVFDANTSVAADEGGLFVINLPLVTLVQMPYDRRIGSVFGRVCAPDSVTVELVDVVRRADACAVTVGALGVNALMTCARVERENRSVTGAVRLEVSPHAPGRLDANVSVAASDIEERSTVSLDLRPLGCR